MRGTSLSLNHVTVHPRYVRKVSLETDSEEEVAEPVPVQPTFCE